MAVTRYFLELSYKGTRYSGFQIQENAHSIQAEVENAFATVQRERVSFTGSSRTDTGVHALQNYFHFDYAGIIDDRTLYKINSVLPPDIVVKSIVPVAPGSHCRFDAISREYKYFIYRQKNPFLNDRAHYFPYKLDLDLLAEAAGIVATTTDFSAFAKRNSQVKTFICRIYKSEWLLEGDTLVYNIAANRFLRGMVKGLTGTMLQVGRKKISIADFREIIASGDCTQADFSVPGKGLFLIKVSYPVKT